MQTDGLLTGLLLIGGVIYNLTKEILILIFLIRGCKAFRKYLESKPKENDK